jgi:hypothetical protein
MLLKLMRAERFGIFRGDFNISFQVQHALNIIKEKPPNWRLFRTSLAYCLADFLSRFP